MCIRDSFSSIELYSSAIIDSIIFPIYNEDFSQVSFLNPFEKNSYKDKVFSDIHNYEIDKNNNKLISIDLITSDTTVLDIEAPSSLIGIDLDMDAVVNPILIDENGLITAYNSDLHILSGFPLDNKVSGIALSKDIIGTESPEIIVKSEDSSKLYIYDNKGHLLLSYSMSKNDDLPQLNRLERKEESILLTWSNKLESELSYRTLLYWCPCAKCSPLRDDEDRKHSIKNKKLCHLLFI